MALSILGPISFEMASDLAMNPISAAPVDTKVAVWPMFSPTTSSGCTSSHNPAFCSDSRAARPYGAVSTLAMATCFTLPAARACLRPLSSGSTATGEPFGAATLSSPRAKTTGSPSVWPPSASFLTLSSSAANSAWNGALASIWCTRLPVHP